MEPAAPITEAGTPVANVAARQMHTVTGTATTATTTTTARSSAEEDAVPTTIPSQGKQDEEHVRLLRKKIAADPEAFFAKVDANDSADLLFEKWEATCKMLVDSVNDAMVRTLFAEIAKGGDTISRSRHASGSRHHNGAQ